MADKEQVISAIRATLLSVKGALTIKQCNRDYRELQGEWIPFKKLGYPTLDRLFVDVPGFKVTLMNGEWYVDAIASQETQHIAAMVSRQKSSKKPTPRFNITKRFPKKKPATTGSYASYNNASYNYNNQYSNQYYRAKGGTPFNNNYSNKNNNTFSIPYETKPPERKTTSKPLTENTERTERTRYNAVSKPVNPPAPAREPERLSERVPLAPVNTRSEDVYSIRTENAQRSSKMSASQRLSSLRDQLNTVDLIPLPLPATNNDFVEHSGPVTHVAPAYSLEPPPDSSSSVDKLEWTCRKLGLAQPVYKVHDIRPKRGPVSYDCSIKVGTAYSTSSYPDSSPSQELAKEVAAVKLLVEIESAQSGGMPTSSPGKAVASLADLVAEHEAGLWASSVPHLYRQKFGENLPSNWQELVKNCSRILKERVVNGLLLLLPNKKGAPPL